MTKITKNREELLETLSAAMDDNCHDRQELSELFERMQQSSPVSAELKQKFESYHMIRDAMHSDLSAVCTPDFSARVSAAIANEPPIVSAAAGGRAQQRAVEHTEYNQKDFVDLSDDSNATNTPVAEHTESPREQAPADELAGYRAKKSRSGKSAGSMFGAGIGGMAVAASAALIALVGFNVFDHSSPGNDALNVAGTAGTAQVVAQDTGDTNEVDPTVVTNQIASVGTANESTDGSTAGRALVNSLPAAPVEFVSNSTTFWVHEQSSPVNRNPANEKRLNQLLTRHLENSPTARMGGLLPYSRIVGYDTKPAADNDNPQVEKVEKDQ